MKIEKAVIEQADIIGKVHSEAWKQTYVGVFPKNFLKEDTASKRKQEFLESFDNKDMASKLWYI